MSYPEIDIHTHKSPVTGTALPSCVVGRDAVPSEGIYAAGIHPWDAGRVSPELLQSYITPRMVAVGEIGLDFTPRGTPLDRAIQETVFRAQLDLAAELGLPVILHCVRAYNEVIKILADYHLPVILHGFTGSPQLARQLTAAGYYLSFGEHLFRSPRTREALKATPLDRLFLETDQSPKNISELYDFAAALIGIQLPELRRQIYKNYESLFGKR